VLPRSDPLEALVVGHLYRYIRSLGPAGTAAPAPVGPGGKVSTPYIDIVPHK
jgi:hypothetical protein